MFPRELGIVSAKYESGGKGVDFVSNGRQWGDPGGDSYGIHQLSGAYSMGAFLRSEWGAKWRDEFGETKPNTDAFNLIYKRVAGANQEQMRQDQHNFYTTTHYVPVRDHAKKLGFNLSDRGVQEALFSMSVQHGGAKKIVSSVATDGVPASAAEQVKALFRERSEYVMSLRTISSKIKSNIVNGRYKNEVKDCLEWVGRRDTDKDIGDYIPDRFIPTEPQKPIETIVNGLGVFFNSALRATKIIASVAGTALKETKDAAVPKIAEVMTNAVKPASDVPWMVTAKNYFGLKEVSGKGSNPTIVNWAKRLGGSTRNVYKHDGIAWCGLFTAHVMNANNIDLGFTNPLGARNWLKFGVECDPQYGAVMVFWRGKRSGWTGHVGLYVSEDSNYYHILGGNQSDSVNVTKIAKSRFLGARWPKNYPTLQKQFAGRVVKKFDGTVSTNEA